jgi:hypothetical protein
MEVRDFINEEVTVFREDGLTPAPTGWSTRSL